MLRKIMQSLTFIGLACASSVYAYDWPGEGLYAGLSGGYGNTRGFERTLTPSGIFFNINNDNLEPFFEHKTTGAAARAFGGFQFNQFFAIEGGYSIFSEAEWVDDFGFKVLNDEQAADVVGKLILPMPDAFSLYAKAGGAYVQSNITGNPLQADFMLSEVTQRKIQDYTVTFGAGASYTIYNQTSLELYWNHYLKHGEIQQIDFLGAGLSYHFA